MDGNQYFFFENFEIWKTFKLWYHFTKYLPFALETLPKTAEMMIVANSSFFQNPTKIWKIWITIS